MRPFSYLSKASQEPCPDPSNTSCSFHPADAFLYSNGTMTDLGALGGTGSNGNAINLSGQVADAAP